MTVFQLRAVHRGVVGVTSALLVNAAERPLSHAFNQGWGTFFPSKVISVFITAFAGHTQLLNMYYTNLWWRLEQLLLIGKAPDVRW